MSTSNQDSGILGAVAAVCLLLIVGGGGFFFYQRTQAMQAAAVVAERKALMAQEQAALNAQKAALQADRASKLLLQEPAVVPEGTVVQKDASPAEGEIVSKLLAQQSDWNKGDLDAFMKVYWNSEKLTFASGGKLTRGYQATLDGYKAKYSTKEQLGQLKFDDLEFQHLADGVMLVLGTWHLERSDNSVGGNFSLIWKKFDDQWLIVHDHTSALPNP